MDTLPAKPLFSIPPSTEPRRPRRPRDKGLSQQPNPPSSTDKKVPTSPRAKAGEPPVLTAAFPEGGDFIPFDDSGPELEKTQQPGQDQRERKRSPPTREWDRGKVRVREPSPPSDQRKRRERSWERDQKDSGRKRKHDTTFDDGYENKKQRTDAASRKAPWVSDVNWESCTNVAEMCVVVVFHCRFNLDCLHVSVQGCIVKSRRSLHTYLQHPLRTKFVVSS